jgi:c-di-AMP phosphodiesterase-like protein
MMYIMAGAMVIMAALSYNENRILFAAEIATASVFVVYSALVGLKFRQHIVSTMKSVNSVLKATDLKELNDLAIAVAAVGSEGDIVWVNSTFAEKLSGSETIDTAIGEDIKHYLYPHTLRQLISNKSVNISHGGREFTVYAAKANDSYVIYFIDDTYYKRISKEYIEKRPVVAMISFDNREEILRNASGGDESRITSEVESSLREWAVTMGGFVRNLSGGRYMMLTDEIHVENAKAKRFEILDKVRQVKGMTGNMRATISVGIGRGADSIIESEKWARQALEMALGRGGDQVAIMKSGETYDFFGGLSRGVEKRDKVRTRVIAATLSDHIKNCSNVIIMGHQNPDMDSIGSALGLWAAITRGLGKNAYIACDEGRAPAKPLIDYIKQNEETKKIFVPIDEALDIIDESTILIVTDTHSYAFVESPELLNVAKQVVVIDHHRMMVTHIKSSIIFYHEPYASSTSEMVAELVQYIEHASINSTEATALLAGIMLDTKNFVLRTGVRTFEASAFLRRRGADTVGVKKLFSNTLEANNEKANLVSSADVYKGCAIASTDNESPNIHIAASQAADELLTIIGVKASFVLFRQGNDVCISARSLGEVNVQVLLEPFGGGGHLTMAGAQLNNIDVAKARRLLISDLDERLDVSTISDTNK